MSDGLKKVLKKVLVVDDETVDRERICNVLRKENYSVVATGTYSGAVNAQARNAGQIDLLITDLSLPERNGCELFRNLAKVEPGLKVLFVSGPTGAEVFKFSDMAIPDLHFLEKPFAVQALLQRVKAILGAEPQACNNVAST